jgi:nitroreductase
MTIRELIMKNRSYRRFYQEIPVDRQVLSELVDLARNSPSAANRQPLKYYVSCDPATNALIFEHLAWAGYLVDWPGPAEGERPAAYILIMKDTGISDSVDCDHGIAAQSILLGAVERGLGGCILGSVRRAPLSQALGLPETLQILLALALGCPKETVVIEPLGKEGDFRYWRDAEGIHHVPKRSLAEILLPAG